MSKRALIPLILALGVSFCLTGTTEARRYYYTGLPTLGGGTAEAWGINDKGQVVGWASTSDVPAQAHAVVWNPASSPTDLGAGDYSYAVGINNLGQIVGTASLNNAQAFFWDPANQTVQTLVNSLGGTQSWGITINDQGQVVGHAETGVINPGTGNKYVHGFLWDTTTTTMQDLNTLGGNESWANAINSLGQIAGAAEISNEEPLGFYLDSTKVPLQMQQLGTLYGWTSAYALNNLNQVVGWSAVAPGTYVHAFLVTTTPGAQPQDLGTLTGNYSEALGLNDRGEVVGEWGVANTSQAAFIWTAAQGMQDLNTLVVNLPAGVSLASALAINQNGQIVGYTASTDPTLNDQAFLLTPINTLPWLPLLMD